MQWDHWWGGPEEIHVASEEKLNVYADLEANLIKVITALHFSVWNVQRYCSCCSKIVIIVTIFIDKLKQEFDTAYGFRNLCLRPCVF